MYTASQLNSSIKHIMALCAQAPPNQHLIIKCACVPGNRFVGTLRKSLNDFPPSTSPFMLGVLLLGLSHY